MTTIALFVQHNLLGNTRISTSEDQPLTDGQIRVKVDSFALTSNNITYAIFGEAMQYWQFFPTGEAGWGIVPVWGFGTVVDSRHLGVLLGEQLYGYWPMANQVVLQPDRLTTSGLTDAAPHRSALHAPYNQYRRCSADPFHALGSEDAQALMRPLFITAWLIDDFLDDNDFFGAKTVLLSSASSKTAYSTAFQLSQRLGIEVVGFTSQKHVIFCESLGCYSRVLTYDALEQLSVNTTCVYMDFTGNAHLRKAIHMRFAHLKYSCSIGRTHVAHLGGAKDLPGPHATLFFAPTQAKKRHVEWGPMEFDKRLVLAWRAFIARVSEVNSPWLHVRHHAGVQAVRAAYAMVLAGKGDPREGHILTLS